MKIYRVLDNTLEVLVTADRIKALEKLYEVTAKYRDNQSWFDMYETEVE